MDKQIKWYFPEENSPSNILTDEFSDSKFSIDKWNSFVREIIQNSIDVPINNEFVLVKFDFKEVRSSLIPGKEELQGNVELCSEINDLNSQTRAKYNNASLMLGKSTIPCLKISDFHTKGVETNVNGDWGAFVYDNGKSSKARPGSAGSHGVGKKAPFIVSSANTVFYNTVYYKNNEHFFQGKTSLVNFAKDGKTYNPKGWFGLVDVENDNRRFRVLPISDMSMLQNFDPFFYERNEPGTDVIVVASDFGGRIEEIKSKIINAVMENFFVGIKENKLSVDVFGVNVDSTTISDCLEEYYQNDALRQTKIDEYDNVRNGNLRNYLNCLSNEPEKIDIVVDNKKIGYLDIYFDLKNDKNRKYYCFFRDHGMKIQDVSLNTDQPFTAVVIARDYDDETISQEDKLNAQLSSRENAAHDTFITKDPDIPCPKFTKQVIEIVNQKIKDFIEEKTIIKCSEDTPIYSITDMMSIQGSISQALSAPSPKLKQKKRKIEKKSKVDESNEYGGVGTKGGKHPKPEPTPNPGPNKPAIEGTTSEGVVFKKYLLQPRFHHTKDGYKLLIQPSVDINANVRIYVFSVDGTLTNIPYLIESAVFNGQKVKVEDDRLLDIELKSEKINSIELHLREGLDYNLDCVVTVK